KCANEKGGVIYQDTACTPGTELGNLTPSPGALSAAKGPSAAKPAQVPPGTAPARGGNAADRRLLQTGMSEAEVVQTVGRPNVEDKGDAKAGPRWTYLPAAGDPNTLTTLTFAGGKVALVERKAVR